MLGDDLGDLLGTRIPGDHSRQVLADHYAARLRATRVMDLGCGTGDSIELFRGLDPEVQWVGVDIEESPEVAERTRGDAEFVTFDGEHLPFDDGSFELVYCKQVLEHVERPRELLREVARVLQPGGWFAGLDIAARGISLAQRLQLDAVRVHAHRRGSRSGCGRAPPRDRRPDARGLARARAANLLPSLVGARVARLPRDRAGGACCTARPPHPQPDKARPRWAVRLPRAPALAMATPLWGLAVVATGHYSVDCGPDRPSPHPAWTAAAWACGAGECAIPARDCS